MKKSGVSYLLGCGLALTSIGTLAAQGTSPATTGAAVPAAAEKSGLDVLKGAWIRPDGGYTIAIKSIGPNGALDPFRALSIVGGHVAPPRNVAGLHVIHRVLGITVTAATFALAYRMRRVDRRAAMQLAALAAAAPLLGAAAIAGMPSLPMTVLHNAAAASLVAALAYLAARKAME